MWVSLCDQLPRLLSRCRLGKEVVDLQGVSLSENASEAYDFRHADLRNA